MIEKANNHDEIPADKHRKELATILGRGLQRLFSWGGFCPVDQDLPTIRKALDVSVKTDPVVSQLTTPRS